MRGTLGNRQARKPAAKVDQEANQRKAQHHQAQEQILRILLRLLRNSYRLLQARFYQLVELLQRRKYGPDTSLVSSVIQHFCCALSIGRILPRIRALIVQIAPLRHIHGLQLTHSQSVGLLLGIQYQSQLLLRKARPLQQINQRNALIGVWPGFLRIFGVHQLPVRKVVTLGACNAACTNIQHRLVLAQVFGIERLHETARHTCQVIRTVTQLRSQLVSMHTLYLGLFIVDCRFFQRVKSIAQRP